VADFKIQHAFKAARLINNGTFKTLYYEFDNRFETRSDVEVRVGAIYRVRVIWIVCGL